MIDARLRIVASCASLRGVKIRSLPEPEVISRKGKPVAVILAIKEYRKIIERLEDAEDAAYLRKARQKPLQYRPLDEVLADLSRK